MNRRCLVLASLAFVLVASCTQAQEAKQAPQNPPAVGQAVAQENLVVARVLGESITENDVLSAINEMAQRNRMPPQQMQQRNALLFKDALDNLIGFALLKNESKEMKVVADPAKVDEAYKGLVKRFPSEDEFKKALGAQGLTEVQLRKNVEENIMYQQVLDQATKDVPAPAEGDIKKFYDDNPQYFVVQEQVHAAHILLKVDPKATPEKKAEARNKLEALRTDIENKKVTFAEAATRNSEDTGSAKNGGDLGFFPRGQMVKPFEDAAFSTKPGTLSPVVESQFGYHLINVIELKPAGKTTLDQSKDNIKNFLERKAKQDAVQKHIADLRSKAAVETVMTVEEWSKRHTPLKN
ncbi:MAG TPA: peptidylprolyl isomerase [Acidobacteriota bacterium]|nr:peptidylprolyl isomerase [Acidobacteriota bacterium]